MYTEHEVFDTPDDDAILWRYLDFTKFTSLLQRSALHFARADALGDPFEGARSRMNRELRPALYDDAIPAESLRAFDQFSKELRSSTFISCWHESDHESAALWNQYAPDSKGIAVQTTCGKLQKSFDQEDSIFIGRLHYVDFDSTFIPENNALAPYTYKRREFSHEHEVRAVAQHYPADFSEPSAGRASSSNGLYYRVSPSVLFEQVVVAPYADEWFVDLVRSIAEPHSVDGLVKPSSMAMEPEWHFS